MEILDGSKLIFLLTSFGHAINAKTNNLHNFIAY